MEKKIDFGYILFYSFKFSLIKNIDFCSIRALDSGVKILHTSYPKIYILIRKRS